MVAILFRHSFRWLFHLISPSCRRSCYWSLLWILIWNFRLVIVVALNGLLLFWSLHLRLRCLMLTQILAVGSWDGWGHWLASLCSHLVQWGHKRICFLRQLICRLSEALSCILHTDLRRLYVGTRLLNVWLLILIRFLISTNQKLWLKILIRMLFVLIVAYVILIWRFQVIFDRDLFFGTILCFELLTLHDCWSHLLGSI